jgi:hypothetical protein
MLDSQIEEFVSNELRWDPKIDQSAIAVSADAGVVTLRGTVGSFRQKRDAQKDAQRVYGVKTVKNELDVQLLNKRTNAELRGDVLQALMLDSMVPSTIDAKVDDSKSHVDRDRIVGIPTPGSRVGRRKCAWRSQRRRRGRDRAAGSECTRRPGLDQESDGTKREAGRRCKGALHR